MEELKCCYCKIEYYKEDLIELTEDVFICEDCYEGKQEEAEERKFQEWRDNKGL